MQARRTALVVETAAPSVGDGGLTRPGAGRRHDAPPAGLQIELMSMQPRAYTLPSGLGKTLIESDGGT